MGKLVALLMVSISAFTAVNSYHAMNVFKGSYQFKDQGTDVVVSFDIDSKGNIQMPENDAYYTAKTAVNSLGNNLGPDGLSLMNIMLGGGSDEQTVTLHIRIYPKQEDDGSTFAKFLDAALLENDGPNHWSTVEKTSIKLFKKQKSGEYIEI